MDKTLDFHTEIYKFNKNNYETIKIRMKNMINIAHSFNISHIEEEIEKNEIKNIQVF